MKKSDLGDVHSMTGEIHTEDMEIRHVLEKQFVQPLRGITPDVGNRKIFELDNAAPVTITDFINGSIGQRIYILGDGFTTITNGTLIKTNTGANKLLAVNKVYTFTFFEILGPPKTHKWVEDVDESGSGGGSSIVAVENGFKSPEATISSTTYVAVNTALDITIAAVAGDKLLINLSGLWDDVNAVWGYLDVATIVGGSPVNFVSGSANGVQAWRCMPHVTYQSIGGSTLYTVQAGDLDSGNVVLRLMGKVASSNKVLYTSVLEISAINLRQ